MCFRMDEVFERVNRINYFGRQNVEQENSSIFDLFEWKRKNSHTLKDCTEQHLPGDSQILLR